MATGPSDIVAVVVAVDVVCAVTVAVAVAATVTVTSTGTINQDEDRIQRYKHRLIGMTLFARACDTAMIRYLRMRFCSTHVS